MGHIKLLEAGLPTKHPYDSIVVLNEDGTIFTGKDLLKEKGTSADWQIVSNVVRVKSNLPFPLKDVHIFLQQNLQDPSIYTFRWGPHPGFMRFTTSLVTMTSQRSFRVTSKEYADTLFWQGLKVRIGDQTVSVIQTEDNRVFFDPPLLKPSSEVRGLDKVGTEISTVFEYQTLSAEKDILLEVYRVLPPHGPAFQGGVLLRFWVEGTPNP
jgi:hypothetical protein